MQQCPSRHYALAQAAGLELALQALQLSVMHGVDVLFRIFSKKGSAFFLTYCHLN